jgi:hypothetical protein
MAKTTRHVIITASDRRCGDFLCDHWLASLRANVDLANIDLAVLDYGLTDQQRNRLRSAGATCRPSRKDGHVTSVRYRDMAGLLGESQYDQVLSVDGGDIVFQSDVSPLFDLDKDRFRAVCEEVKHDFIVPKDTSSPERFRAIFTFLEDKPIINGGVIFGPAWKFRTLWGAFQELWGSRYVYGTDQLIMNYLLHKHGFTRLDNKYNFVIVTARSAFRIQGGVFYDAAGDVIPIVHNAGGNALVRCVRRFGYGRDRNKKKWLTSFLLRVLFSATDWQKRWRRRAGAPKQPSASCERD